MPVDSTEALEAEEEILLSDELEVPTEDFAAEEVEEK